MFAGPNGSGKSTLLREIIPETLRGIYLNPDEIEKIIRSQGFLVLADYGIKDRGEAILSFIQNSAFIHQSGLSERATSLSYRDGRLHFPPDTVNAYFASVAADFMRHALLDAKVSFTFETVMSSPDKVAFLAKAQTAGCRTYLYYVATDDPIINESRVQGRVATGGHPVPMEKIASRYHRSLALLPAAIDYDYIMSLCARFSQQTPGKQKMSREKLIGIIEADAKFIDERETITAYVRTLEAGQGLNQKEIEAGYQKPFAS